MGEVEGGKRRWGREREVGGERGRGGGERGRGGRRTEASRLLPSHPSPQSKQD